jgi:hypothetical protein
VVCCCFYKFASAHPAAQLAQDTCILLPTSCCVERLLKTEVPWPTMRGWGPPQWGMGGVRYGCLDIVSPEEVYSIHTDGDTGPPCQCFSCQASTNINPAQHLKQWRRSAQHALVRGWHACIDYVAFNSWSSLHLQHPDQSQGQCIGNVKCTEML